MHKSRESLDAQQKAMLDRVIVTRHIIDACHMQVCAVKNATDKEMLEVANAENPAGTTGGWSTVLRDNKNTLKTAPVECNNDPERIHFILQC